MKRGPSITGCLPLSDLPSIKWRYDIKTAKIKGWVNTQYGMLGFTGAESLQTFQSPVKCKYSHTLRTVCNNLNEVHMLLFLALHISMIGKSRSADFGTMAELVKHVSLYQ